MERNTPEQKPEQITRLLEREILRAGEHNIADLIGKSKASISRKTNGEEGWTLEQLGELFAYLNIKIVHRDQIVVDAEEWASTRLLAARHLAGGEG